MEYYKNSCEMKIAWLFLTAANGDGFAMKSENVTVTIVIDGVAFSRTVEKSDPELPGEILSSVCEFSVSNA
ncbi:polysaccharide deacetylase 2 family uncharacterized protein YibQ [Paraburkholderia sp. GAS348]